MGWDASNEDIWKRYQGVIKVNRQLKRCVPAQKLYDVITPLCEEAIQSQSLLKINQTKLRIQDSYFSHREMAKGSHRNYMSNRPSHICLYAVYEEAFMTLKNIELQLQPPLLFIPPPEPPAQPTAKPQVAGIFLEELDE
jgi:hypothetical protein